jgi:hypothetical protein
MENDDVFYNDICELTRRSRETIVEQKIKDQIKQARVWIRDAAQRGDTKIVLQDGRPEVALYFTTLGFEVDTSAGTYLLIKWK